MIANSEFTSWMAFKRLAIVAELYEGHTSKTYNRLKTIITDDNIEVNEKYEKSYRIKNHIHIVASSNDFRALKIDDGDRRWLVPGVTERKRSHDYWKHFHRWLGHDGLGIIARWAREYVEEHGYVLPGVEAPQSEAKRRAQKAAMSEGEQMIVELGESIAALATEGVRVVVRLDEIRFWLADRKSNLPEYGPDGTRFLEKPETIAARLKGCGLHILQKQLYPGKFRVVANFEPDLASTWDDLRPFYRKPEELCPTEKGGRRM
jgi:hypothetical protein